MTDDKVTISRETLQAAIDALECALSDSRPYIVKSREVSTTLRAALAAQPAEPVEPVEPVAWRWRCKMHSGSWGDWKHYAHKPQGPASDTFEMEPLYAAPPAPALTYEQIRDLAKESGLDWHRGYMPLFDDDPTNRYEVFARAVLAAGVLPAPAAVPLTKEQRELFDLILHHYGPDKRLQPLRDLIAAAGDKP